MSTLAQLTEKGLDVELEAFLDSYATDKTTDDTKKKLRETIDAN